MASWEGFTPNGWQRAALLVAGFGIAVGTVNGTDHTGDMRWIVGAVVATAMVLIGLKGIRHSAVGTDSVQSKRARLGLVLTLASLVLLLALLLAVQTSRIEDARRQGLEDTQKATEAQRVSSEMWFEGYAKYKAVNAVLSSNALAPDELDRFKAAFEKEYAFQLEDLIKDNRRRGLDVSVLEGLLNDQRIRLNALAIQNAFKK